jgi:SAM-dependent methyltransferase
VQRVIGRELTDQVVDDSAELEAGMRDIAFTNVWFGGTAPVVRCVRRVRARTVLDVGSGLGDIPLALVRDAQRRGTQMHVTCLDRSEQMLSLARHATGAHPALRFVCADGGALPFADGAFDVVTCNLALHHFDPPHALALLAELRRVAATTPLICDLRRSRLALAGVWLWSRTTRSRLARHDGPLSVRRAYTPTEAMELARSAGWRRPQVQREAFFRMTLVDLPA